MIPRCFKINAQDNVATLLDDAPAGALRVLGEENRELQSFEPIALGHKIAICDIAEDQPIIKFGVTIGRASKPIRAGEWVHLHNVASEYDQRSQTLEVHTGAVTDTKYE